MRCGKVSRQFLPHGPCVLALGDACKIHFRFGDGADARVEATLQAARAVT